MTDHPHTITLNHFWAIKIPLISFVVIASFLFGIFIGIRRMEAAQQFAHDAVINEYPIISIQQSYPTFCYDRGTAYKVEMVPTARAGRPMFRVVK